jgi:pentatricopeptide repeat protein
MQRTSAGGALLSKNMYSHMTLALCTAADSRGQASAWDEAVEVLNIQLNDGVTPSPYIFSRLLSACPLTRTPTGIHVILRRVASGELDLTSEQTTHIFNSGLASLNRSGVYEETLHVWNSGESNHLRPLHLQPDKYTMSLVVSACNKSGRSKEALVHVDHYFDSVAAGTTTTRTKTKEDLVLLNGALLAAARACDMSRAQDYLERIRVSGATPDSYTMHSLLLSLTANDRARDALAVICDWQDRSNNTNTGGGPTAMSFNILLQACSDSCDLDTANVVLLKMEEMDIAPDQNSSDLVVDIFGENQDEWTFASKAATSRHEIRRKQTTKMTGDEEKDTTFINVRNSTAAQCRATLHEAIQRSDPQRDLIVITGFGKMHETSIQFFNERGIEYEETTRQKHRGRIIVPLSEIVQYSIQMENQVRNEIVMRSSLVRLAGVSCLIGLPLFGNPIFLFFMQ